MKNLLLVILLSPLFLHAQEAKENNDKESGKLQLGVRSTLSSFNHDGTNGYGVGGQFRLKFGSRLNTEWFADYITTDISGLARRIDNHIGWAVQFYPLNNEIAKGKFTPFIAAGHCFDYTNITKNTSDGLSLRRWSSAVHSGLGTHYNITDKFDVSLSALYMMHLGKNIDAQPFEDAQGNEQVLIQVSDLGLEGHLLISLSLNVYIADLW